MLEFLLEDVNLRIRGSRTKDGQRRLIIDYPATDHYHAIVHAAFVELFRPRKSTEKGAAVSDNSAAPV